MLSLLLIVAIAVLLLAVVGVAVLAWLPDSVRPAFLPATLVLGAMALVVGLHATSLVVGVRFGVLIVLASALVAVAVRTRRVAWWRRLGDPRWLVLAVVAGAIPFIWVIAPARAVGATFIAPTSGDDGFSFVTVSTWLLDHPATVRPDPAHDEPAWGYTHVHLDIGLRIGEELDQAAIAAATFRDPEQTYYVVMALWLLLLPGAVVTAAALLRAPPVAGVAAGVIAAGSAVLGFQVLNSNSASMLGITGFILTTATFARGIDDRVSRADTPVPIWLMAGLIAAWAGTYTEYLPVVGPGLLAFLLCRQRANIGRALVAAARTGALALVIAPLVWFDAVRSLVTISGNTDTGRVSGFLGAPLVVISHITGNRQLWDLTGTRFALPLLGALVLGLALAITLGSARRFALCLGGSAVLVVLALSTVRRYPYGQERAVQSTLALFLMLATLGLADGVRRLHRMRREAGISALALALLPGATFLYVNHRSVAVVAAAADPTRHVDSAFADATQWIRAHAGPDGANAMVVSADHFDQLWLLYATRGMSKLAYPFVYQDYAGVEPLHYNDGRLRRWAVVDVHTFLDADASVVVGRDSRFLFLDLSRGRAIIAVGATNFLSSQPTAGGMPSQWMSNDGDLLVVHTEGTPAVELEASALAQTSPETVTVSGNGVSPITWSVTADSVVTVPLPSGIAILHLHNSVPAAHPSPGDPSQLSILLLGAHRA